MIGSSASGGFHVRYGANVSSDDIRRGTVVSGSIRVITVVFRVPSASAGEGAGSAGTSSSPVNKSEVAARKAAACVESPPVVGPAAGAAPAAVTENLGLGGAAATVCGVI